MRTLSSVLLLCLGALTSATLAAQGVPQTINYQGRLTDNGTPSPTPVNGLVTIRFDLYDAPTGGSSLWNETDAVAVNGGMFSVMLGTVTPLPPAVFAGSAERHLQLTLNPAGAAEALSPRQRIGMTGFAAKAEQAASAADSAMLGGAPSASWQRALSGGCGGSQFLTGFSAGGTPACATPQTQIPVPLNLTGSDPNPLFHVTQNGSGQGIWSDVTAGGSTALVAVNGGTGRAGVFQVTNAASASPAVYATTAGAGDAILGVSTGHNGVSGLSASAGDSGVYGENTGLGRSANFRTVANPANTAATLEAYNGAAGSAGVFTAAAAGNLSPALVANGSASGPAASFNGRVSVSQSSATASLLVSNGGAGAGGQFQLTSAVNSARGLAVTTAGTGEAIFGQSAGHNGVAGLSGSANDSGIYGENTGLGRAAFFRTVADGANAAATVEALNTTQGSAGVFTIQNPASETPALVAATNGGGPAASFIGPVSITGKATSTATAAGDAATTLATKGYVDSVVGAPVPPVTLGASLPGPVLTVTQGGSGRAAQFAIGGASNSEALYVSTAGSGPALGALTTGTGRAGFYQINSTGNLNAALQGTTNGLGAGLAGYNTATSGATTGVYASVSSASGYGFYTPNRGYFGDDIYSAGGYGQPGTGGETLKIIRGRVTGAGAIAGGGGFTVSRTATGNYTVTFQTAFSNPPAVTVSADPTGNALRSASAAPAPGSVQIYTYNLNPVALADIAFSFIAVGTP